MIGRTLTTDLGSTKGKWVIDNPKATLGPAWEKKEKGKQQVESGFLLE
jgi:hypothetical protein